MATKSMSSLSLKIRVTHRPIRPKPFKPTRSRFCDIFSEKCFKVLSFLLFFIDRQNNRLYNCAWTRLTVDIQIFSDTFPHKCYETRNGYLSSVRTRHFIDVTIHFYLHFSGQASVFCTLFQLKLDFSTVKNVLMLQIRKLKFLSKGENIF